MKSTILANVALCACPPLVATATVATMPGARHAVHRLTAPPRHPAHKKQVARSPCAPVKGLRFAALPLDDKAIAALLSPGEGETPAALTVAADDPSPPNLRQSSGGGGSGGYSALFPGGPGPLIGPPPTPPISPVAPVIPPAAVPEPASWVMMIAGFSGVGALHRRRNRHRGRAARLAGGAVAVAELLGATGLASARTAALASHKASTAIGTSLASAVAKKAAVCVCSGAILTAAVTTVPPLKRAVHAATMPARALSHENCKPA